MQIAARGIVDRGDPAVVRCLGPFAPGLIVGGRRLAPAGQPNTVVILAVGAGSCAVTLLFGPEAASGRPGLLTINVASA